MSLLHRIHFELSYLLGLSPWDSGASPPELIEFLQGHPPGRAIDLGCGTGTNVITLARSGWQVTGVDFSRSAIAVARRKARAAGIHAEFVEGDVSSLEQLPGPFDLALDIGCYHSLTAAQQARYADGLSRLVRPGGIYLLYGFERRDLSRPETWLTEQALRRRFSPAFDLLRLETGTDRERPSTWATLVRAT